jgi:hypothetical protein
VHQAVVLFDVELFEWSFGSGGKSKWDQSREHEKSIKMTGSDCVEPFLGDFGYIFYNVRGKEGDSE